MSGVKTNALPRALSQITIGAVKGYDQLKALQAASGLTELDQQFQVPITGAVGAGPAWQTLDIVFPGVLIDAKDERRVPFSAPLFTYGAVITYGPQFFVTANVRKWDFDDYVYKGATLDVGVYAPGVPIIQNFKGELHLNFQGYGSPVSDQSTGDDDL